jgi:hypothetical protein
VNAPSEFSHSQGQERRLNDVQSSTAVPSDAEVEPNTFVDERPDIDDMDDGFLPHHYCDETDLRDLLRSFEIIRLWIALRESGARGKWIASARRPLSDG